MKKLLSLVLGLAAWLAVLPVQAAVSCSLTANPELKVIYTSFWGNANLSGTISLACTRASNDPQTQAIWIGMDQGTNGGTATVEGGTATMGYEIYHSNGASGTWTSGNGVPPGSTTNGAIADTLNFGTGSTDTNSYVYYLRVPSFQILKPAGVYVDSVTFTIRRTNASGTIISTATLPVYISVPKACRFSTAPTPVNIVYPAFSPVAVTGRSDFAITCTQGTDYTIELDRTRSVIPTVELGYSLVLSQTAATGIAVAQPYTVNISVDAGQAGRCAASSCQGTDVRTLTVRY